MSSPEEIHVRLLHPDAKLPTRSHPGDAGLDLYCLEDRILRPGHGETLPTGVALAVPPGHAGIIADRSSMAKRGVKTAGGVIDAGYRGEIGVVAWNLTEGSIRLRKGDRVAQLLIVPIAAPAVKQVEALEETARGEGGFGSTGR